VKISISEKVLHATEEKTALFCVINCREAMCRMKEGEEEKTKSYTALVWTQKPIEREDITFIDNIKVRTSHTSVWFTE